MGEIQPRGSKSRAMLDKMERFVGFSEHTEENGEEKTNKSSFGCQQIPSVLTDGFSCI